MGQRLPLGRHLDDPGLQGEVSCLIHFSFSSPLLAPPLCVPSPLNPRLAKDLSALAPENTEVKLQAMEHRQSNVWTGLSLLAMSAEFFDMCVTPEELEESGEELFLSKCAN